MKLEEALQDCTLALLRKIAANHGVAVEEEVLRGELSQLLLQRLLEPAYLGDYLSTLTQDEIAVLDTVRGNGWMAKAFVLERLFPQRAGPKPPTAQAEPSPSLSLLQKGLLFRTFAPIAAWRGEVYYVPEELRPTILPALPAAAPRGQADLRTRGVPEVVVERNIPFDLFCLLSFLRRDARKLQRGALSRADLAKLEQEVDSPPVQMAASRWEERWRFLLHLCLAGGWVRREGAILKPARGAERLLAGTPDEVRTRLLERYLRDRNWSDLAAAGRVRQPLGGRRIDEAAARRLLIHHLEEMAAEGWTDEKAFCEALRSTNPDFLREDYSSLSWAVVEVATDAELYGTASWDAVEGDWIRYVLRGPLQWLGVVRWGLSRAGEAVGFQFRPAVDTRGTSGPRVDAQELPSGVIREDFELSAPEDCDLGLLYRLEPYLELRRRGRVSSYRLTRESMLEGLEKGGSREEVRELLLRAVEPMPANLLSQVDRWAADHGRFLLEAALLLTTATPEDAELLRGLPEVAACLVSRLGPRTFRVPPERIWELAQRLKKSGHLPRVDAGVKLEGARRAAGDVALLRESLFALRVLRSLQEGLEMGNGAEALRRLEAALGPEEVEEISRRAQAAVKQLRQL